MHHRKAVERVALEILLAHSLVSLSSQSHVVPKLSKLLEHQVVISSLLEAHCPKYRFVSKSVC